MIGRKCKNRGMEITAISKTVYSGKTMRNCFSTVNWQLVCASNSEKRSWKRYKRVEFFPSTAQS